MTALARQVGRQWDPATSASSLRFVEDPEQPRGLERSDRYSEWALKFEQDIKRLVDRLHAWSRNPQAIADDDYQTPTKATIALAVYVADGLKVMAMDRVGPSGATLLNVKGASIGSGGEITIELAAEDFAVTFRAEPNGMVTHSSFRDNRLVSTQTMQRV